MTLRDWFEKAQKEKFAIGAFNIDTLETLKAVVEAARLKKSPVIVEFSPGEVGYFGLANIVDLINNIKEEYKLPIFLNLDHGKSPESVIDAIKEGEEGHGFDQVHFDGSDLELSKNIEACKKVVDEAHKKKILVEGEINKISGHSQVNLDDIDLNALKDSYTKVEEASKFVTETGVDVFAPSFGNVHGTFPTQPDLDLGLLTNLTETLPTTYLAMHGGSGIPADQVNEAIKAGKIVKINVNTELRQAYKDALGEKLEEKPNEYAFYNISLEVVLAIQAVVENKIEAFGSAGKA